MKPMLTTIFIMLLSVSPALAPADRCIYVADYPAVNIYEALLSAVTEVESKGDTLAYNPFEDAYGPLQIRPIRLTDYNLRTGKKYVLKDCYRPGVSREIFIYYAVLIGPYDLERIAKQWNGSGKMTIDYWHRVNESMQSAAYKRFRREFNKADSVFNAKYKL